MADGQSLVQSYGYDKLNRLIQVNLPESQTLNLDYYANDERQIIRYPSGITIGYSYFNHGPVKTITVRNSAAQILEQLIYTYDTVLNVDSLNNSDGTHNYTYDRLDRLTQSTHPAGVGLPTLENFAYDLEGNREDSMDPSLYDYDANNRITRSPSLTYSFDDDGNQIGRSDGADFAYNAFNRLTNYTQDATASTYAYSPLGPRLRKSVNGQTTYYLWDGYHLIGE